MKRFLQLTALTLCILLLAACGSAPAATSAPTVTTDAPQATTAAPTTLPQAQGIRNIIIIIGDGMGDAQVAAGQLASGKTYGFTAWPSTHSDTNSLDASGNATVLTDSAAGGTALSTGTLTVNGRVARGPQSEEPLTTILDHAQTYGKATGVVSTDYIYGATPASFSGHAADRDDHTAILLTQLESGIDLFCASYDAEAGTMKSNIEAAGYTFTDFSSKVKSTLEAQRVYWLLNMAGSQPGDKLEKYVPYALDFLDKDPDGFVVMIEQAHVDKYCHGNDIEGTQLCVNSLNNTVDAILDWLGDREDTAIIITADHETGGLSVSDQEEYEHRYVSDEGKVLYYEYSSTGHTTTPVSVYFYGFEPELSPYYINEEQTLIKNISVFEIMLDLLENPVRD